MNKLPSTLFIGDLSIFCTIQDIEKVFSTFGPIVDIRIKRDENTNKNLSYGFVKYVLVNSAEQALNNLNGYVLCGRPMRISWASFKPKQSGDSHETDEQGRVHINPGNQAAPTKSSVHVSFTTLLPDIVVTEELLRNMFVSFGDIVDVTIKKAIVINTASIKGFGFVHFRDDPAGMRSAVTSANALANFILHDVSYQCTISRELEQRIKAEGYVHDQDPAAASMGFNNVLSTMGGSQEAYRPAQQQTHIQQQHYQQQYQQNQHPSHQQQHAQYPPVPFQSQHSQAHQQQYPDQRYSAHHPPHGSEYGQRDYPMAPRVVSPLPFMPSAASGRYPHLMGGYSEPPSSFAPQVHAMHQQSYEHLGGAKDYHSHHAALSHQPQHQQPPMAQYSPYHAASQPGHAQMPPPPGPVQHAYPPPPQAEFQRPNFPAHIHIPSQATLGFHQHSLPYGQGAPSFSPGSTGGGNTSSSTVSPLSQDGSGHGMGVSPVSAYHAVVHQQQQQTHHQYPRPIVHQQNYNTNTNNSNGQLLQQSGPAPPPPLSTAEALSQALQTGRDLKPPSVLYANLHYKGLQAAKRGDGEN